MSCRTTPAGSAWTTIARLESGLTDVQTLSTFHALRRDGRGLEAPTAEEWANFIAAQREALDGGEFSEARLRSLNGRLDRAAEQVPDGATWYALRNIRDRAALEASTLESSLRIFADRMGETYESVSARFNQYMSEVDRSRSAAAPEGYEEARSLYRHQHLPADPGTYAAYQRIAMESVAAVNAAATPPRRVEHVPFPNSHAVHSAGYDPHDGRLEVVFRRRDREGNTVGTSRTYAYRGVPAEVWAEMTADGASPGAVYSRLVRNHSEYRYESQQDEEAAAHRRCGNCGQWWAPGHACPTPAAESAPATSSMGTRVVSESRDGRTRLVEALRAEAARTLAGEDPLDSDYERRVRALEADGMTRSDAQAVVDAQVRDEAVLAHEDASRAADLADQASASSAEDEDEGEAYRRCDQCGEFMSIGHTCAAAAPEPEPEREPEPEPEPERPVRPARSLGLYCSSRRINSRRVPNWDPSSQDYAYLPPITELRSVTQSGPVLVNTRYSGYRRGFENEDLPSGYFSVSGTVIFDRPARGEYTVEANTLRCDCALYRENGDCPHISFAMGRFRQHFAPSTGTGARASVSPEDVAAAQAAAEEAMRQDWMRSEELAEEARARHAATSNPQDSYTNNFTAFEEDHQAALARKANGEEPVPFMRENALNGEFTRESGRGFGVEMEFDFPNTMSNMQKQAALRAIGADLHAAGLTGTPQQQWYHASASRGYVDTHQGGWSYEQDCTVSGEIVSPIMYDEPETWNNIEKVCEIVRRHGGVANAKTGSHVHVSAPRMTTQTATELMQMTNQHEDVMYRLSQNPDRSSHRPLRWCGPNGDAPQGGYTEMYEVSRINSHGNNLNLGGVRGEDSDHPEIRHWDGTLNAAVIQAQVKVSTGLVRAAERNAGLGMSRRNREKVGSHATRLQAVRGRSRRALTSEELDEDTATARSFIDTLFTRREDKAQVASLFAVTNWQRANQR